MGPATGIGVRAAVAWEIIAFGAPALAAERRDAARGQALYVEYCSQCHGGRPLRRLARHTEAAPSRTHGCPVLGIGFY